MPTNLTTPISKETVTDVTLDGFAYTVDRSGDLVVSQVASKAFITVSFRDADGVTLYTKKFDSSVSALPLAVKQAIKGVHEAIITWAKDAGKIPAGAETPDF